MQQYHESFLPQLKIFKHKTKEGVVERVSIEIYACTDNSVIFWWCVEIKHN